jgi:hypothetical protein
MIGSVLTTQTLDVTFDVFAKSIWVSSCLAIIFTLPPLALLIGILETCSRVQSSGLRFILQYWLFRQKYLLYCRRLWMLSFYKFCIDLDDSINSNTE